MLKSFLRLWVRDSVVNKGLRGNSKLWLTVGAFSLLRRGFDRKGRKVEQVALTERIRPGDELVLRYPGKPGRKTRKEIAVVSAKRAAAEFARQREIARLESLVQAGGRKGRKAASALAELRQRSA